MSLTWPNHQLTLAEWEALPQTDDAHLELAEGLVVMAPKPLSYHQKASMRMGTWLDDQLPRPLTALTDVEMVVTEQPLTIRAPDVVVTRTHRYLANPPRYAAADVLLAVEILSDGTRRTDRVLKFAEYAESGIPQYWIVDLGAPTTLLAYQLVDGDYELSGERSGRVELPVAGHLLTIDLDALTRR